MVQEAALAQAVVLVLVLVLALAQARPWMTRARMMRAWVRARLGARAREVARRREPLNRPLLPHVEAAAAPAALVLRPPPLVALPPLMALVTVTVTATVTVLGAARAHHQADGRPNRRPCAQECNVMAS